MLCLSLKEEMRNKRSILQASSYPSRQIEASRNINYAVINSEYNWTALIVEGICEIWVVIVVTVIDSEWQLLFRNCRYSVDCH